MRRARTVVLEGSDTWRRRWRPLSSRWVCYPVRRLSGQTGERMNEDSNLAGSSLTPRQQRFVDEYLADLNATQAAIRAGYSARTANEQGARLLAKASIAEAVQAAQKARGERLQITQDDVVRGLRREATLSGEGSSHAARVSAWGLLGKHLGMFTERMQQIGPDGRPIERFPPVFLKVIRG